MSNSLVILRNLFITARRDKLFLGIIVFLCLSFVLSAMFGDLFLVEKATASAVYLAGSSRLIINLGIILFTCFTIKTMFDNKEVQFILARPISRRSFVFCHWLGFGFIALAIVAGLTAVMALLLPINKIGLAFWGFSLTAEVITIITFALLAALILKSAVFAIMSTIAFYFVSRLIGYFSISINFAQSWREFLTLDGFTHTLLRSIALFFPRLDLFCQGDWLVYGLRDPTEIWLGLAQTVIYLSLLLLMSCYDFKRKQF